MLFPGGGCAVSGFAQLLQDSLQIPPQFKRVSLVLIPCNALGSTGLTLYSCIFGKCEKLWVPHKCTLQQRRDLHNTTYVNLIIAFNESTDARDGQQVRVGTIPHIVRGCRILCWLPAHRMVQHALYHAGMALDLGHQVRCSSVAERKHRRRLPRC